MSRFQIYKGEDSGEQCWRWRLLTEVDGKDENIAHSEEPFLKKSIVGSIKTLRDKVPNAPIWKDESIEDQDKGYRFEYHQSKADGKWKWKFRAGNHETMAIGDAYESEDSLKTNLEHIKTIMGSAEITWENPQADPSYQEKHDDRTETKGIPGS